MSSDEDDMPLTFRRSSGPATVDKPNARPRAPPPSRPPLRKPGQPGPGQMRSAPAQQKRKEPEPSGSASDEDEAPLSLRASANGGASRPVESGTGALGLNGQQAKRARLAPDSNGRPQSQNSGRSGLTAVKAESLELTPASRAPNVPSRTPASRTPPTPPASRNSPVGTPASNQRRVKEELLEEEEGDEEDEEGEEEDEGDEEGEEEEEEEDEGDEEDASEEDDMPLSQRAGTKAKPTAGRATPQKKAEKKGGSEGGGGRKKKEDNTVKWKTLSHNGVIFPPPYTPHGIKIFYNKKPVVLTPEQEEVATMFAVMRETEYYTKPKFLSNFWDDWKKILGPKHVIQRLDLCDFTPIWEWHCAEKEKKKQMTTEEKKRIKEEKMKAEEKYMWAVIDGVKEKVGNFRVEPPGLFRGRGEHPKMGKLKKRIMPEDITINVGKEAPVPQCPIPGHRWREVRNDNTVTWLAYWADPINPKEFKYVFLAASSRLKGLSDKEKYEKARRLKDHIVKIRATYTKNFKSPDETTRQIAVATYLIDRLALRAGNEKDDDEADTVGCCSLKVEHVKQVPPSSLQFDFLGKDSIRYFNTVEVVPEVYKAIGDFQKKKKGDEDLFNRLDTSKLNAHLKEIMPGLTAKVFRTYNASITLDNLLQDTVGADVKERVADYQRANKEVAILCNHQKSVSKAHANQMEKMQGKISELETTISELEEDLMCVKKGRPLKQRPDKEPPSKTPSAETLEKKIAQAKGRLDKMKLDRTIKDELKTVALGTSKINYMDPRITIAWCKLHDVPIEKIFNKSLLAKFAWAMDVEPDFRF